MVRPWHAAGAMALPRENGKPARATVEARRVSGSDVRGSMSASGPASSHVRQSSWRSGSPAKGAPAHFSVRILIPGGKCVR